MVVRGIISLFHFYVPITWWGTQRASLACVVPSAERIATRRPPPPLDAEDKLKTKDKPYTWWRGNDEIKRVSANGTVEVSRKKDGSTEGVYQCAALHHGGLVLGYPVHLKFAFLDKFTAHPQNVTAWLGQPFTLTCNISSGPPAAITWLKDNEALPKSNRYHVLKNQLLIMNVSREDVGFYKCKATNKYVNKVRTSYAGRLQVEELKNEPSHLSIIPLSDDTNIVVAKESTIVLPCPVGGKPRPKLTWQLTPPGDRTRELEENDEVLVLTNIQLDQEGVYTCSVDGYHQIAKSFNVTITEPVVIKVPPVSKESFRASTVRFNCTATGRPNPDVVWYKNGKPLPLAGRIAVLPSADGNRLELLIRTVTSDDAGVYQCFASNGVSVASAWGLLNVTGDEAAAPRGLSCRPTGPNSVALRWENVTAELVAYTIQITTPEGESLPRQPVTTTDALIDIDEPLTPHSFHIRAFIKTVTNKTIASDMSEGVTCQGQGVPITLTQLSDDSMMVSWKEFADHNPDILEWILQYRTENSSETHNITLNREINNYTLNVTSDAMEVRVLGSKSIPWLDQDLSLVKWSSSAIASPDIDGGDVLTLLTCILKIKTSVQERRNKTKSMTVEGLEPGNAYEVQIQVRLPTQGIRGKLTKPISISTLPKGRKPFGDLVYKVENTSAIRITWSSVPRKYTVLYSNDREVPFQEWTSIETIGNTAVLTDLDLTKKVFVKIKANEPPAQSPIITIPALNPEATDLQYSYVNSGVKVWWRGPGPRVVRYSQNLTQSVDKWPTINVTQTTVTITGLDPLQLTYVMVAPPGLSRSSQVITIQPRPVESYPFYMSLAISCAVVLLCLMMLAAACIWRRRKKLRSPLRSRRRNLSPTESNEEQASEMKNIGGRLANGGGSKDAGEPLLNGHVHITENPTSKTPNGRVRKYRQRNYEATFDLARYDEPDTTLDTVLEADTTASTTFSLLDTSRQPEYDVSRPREVHDPFTKPLVNESFNKLPDDNMNSELNRSTEFTVDNSRIQPTLQPNG
ncbi:hypothetical protein K1T71_006437 [Dendrolimus kikuchii]|uniref:Uncharacterized protein n=1 Tax=Dendrolimus kikuchii TaxID=765133 RepID=A0ACC1D1F9_9NEOP|nr:hypothetical protein K1T71_006437 [Dendrolimus kikuchii]